MSAAEDPVVMVPIAAGQLQIWAKNIRSAASELFSPGELAVLDQDLADLPEDPAEALERLMDASPEDQDLRRRWNAYTTLRLVAQHLEFRAG